MSASNGPKIVRDGLVFAYDINNQKSNKGKPTTNLIQPANDGNNTTHPSYRPYSGAPHFGGGTVTTTEVPSPHPGLTVYKHTDDGVDTQTGRLSIRYAITQGLLSYDTTYCHSYYVWLPSEYADRWGNGQRGGLYQNTAGGDWHSWRGYNATYSNYGAGNIYGTSLVGGSPSGPWGQMYDKTKLDQWQRVYAVFTPLTDNINVPGEGDLDNNVNATGWYRYVVSNGVSGGDPFHIYTSGGMLEEGVTSPAPWTYTERTVNDAVSDLTKSRTITIGSTVNYGANGETFDFNGANSHVTYPHPVSVTNPYTVIMWAKPGSPLSAGGSGAAKPDGTNRRTLLFGLVPSTWNPGIWVTSDYIRAHADTQYVDVAVSWTTADYAMVGMTYDGTDVSVIFNGDILPAAFTTAYAPADSTDTILGGESTNGSQYSWLGNIDLVRHYNRALSADEIRQNFEAHRRRFGL